MSLTQRLFNRTDGSSSDNEEESKSQSTLWLDGEVEMALEFLFDKPTPPAYNLTRDQKFSIPETVTIAPVDNSPNVKVTVTTPTDEISFEIRITGYTSRFGELDVEYITVSGYALNLYHPRPDKDNSYFVRRLYYYADEDGVGGEQHRDDSSAPHSPSWIRSEHKTDVVTVTETESHIEVYDWRQKMATHDKPTPSDGEVVIRYRDSLNKGGNRSRENIVVQTEGLKSIVGGTINVDFIQVDVNTGELVLYASSEKGKWYVFHLPISEDASIEDVSVDSTTEFCRPSKKKNVVWVRDPAYTWIVNY